jgi:type 1 glutamine amidotransferase
MHRMRICLLAVVAGLAGSGELLNQARSADKPPDNAPIKAVVAIENPAPIERVGAPPLRSRAEVEAVLKNAEPVETAKLKPLEVVLVSGPKDHGPGEHDYPQWRDRWTRLLQLAPQVTVSTADLWPTPKQWQTADGVVIFSANQGWSPERAGEMDAFFARGGGMVFLHWGVNGQRAPEELARRIGLAWQGGRSKYRHGPLDLQLKVESKHPIVAGFQKAQFIDESYWNLAGDASKITVLGTQVEEGQPQPLMWTYEPGHGRVFVSILGHYNWTFDDPLYRVLLLRGMAWTMNQPTDRFNDLIFRGARVNDP